MQLDPSMFPYSEEVSDVASLAILSGPEAGRNLLVAKAASVIVNAKLVAQFCLDDLKRVAGNVQVRKTTL